jgi:hypothetical protein
MPEQVSISVVSSGVTIAAGAVTSVTAGTGLTGGNITSSGTIAADFAASGSATANKVVEATDSRLSNARTPTTHGSSHGVSGSDAIPADGLAQSQVANLTTDLAAKVPSTRQVIAGTGLGGGGALSADVTLTAVYGTSSTTACVGNDARLSNPRTPEAHANTHQAAGSDPLTLSQSQITNLVTDLAAKALSSTQVIAGTGLTGGGDLTANRTLAVAYGSTSSTATVGDDARLSFTAAGTGATARTLQNKLRDVVSVKDFGAVGNGIANDTSAFTAALAAADNVFVPAGTYNITSTISVAAKKCLYGVGFKSNISATIAGAPAISVNGGLPGAGSQVVGIRISGSAQKGLYVTTPNVLIDNISLSGLTATDGFVFVDAFSSTFSNLSTSGATISNACFVCGQNFNANNCSTWYTSNFCTYNVLLDSTYEGGSGWSHGSNFSMVSCQGGRYGLFVGSFRGACFNSFYSENIVTPVRLGDQSNAKLAIGISISGGDLGGPLNTHPQYASREAAIWFDYAFGCTVRNMDFSGPYNCGSYAPITISDSGGGTGAAAIARVTTAGAVHSVHVICPGTGYTAATVANVGGVGAGAILSVTRSGSTIASIGVTNGGSGYVPSGLPVAITYKVAAKCSVDSVYINSSIGLYSPLYPWLVRRSSAGTESGITINNDTSWMNQQNGNSADLRKTRSYGYTHALLEWDNTGASANSVYTPPQYP